MNWLRGSDWRGRQAFACILTLLAVLGLVGAGPHIARDGRDWTWQAQKLMRKARTGSLTGQREGHGYYEQLLNATQAVGASRLGTFLDTLLGRRVKPAPPIVERHRSFLVYEYRPNLDVWHHREGHLITNAYGLADSPCSLEKPAGTRRIALLGDSISRSMGVPFGQNYEALLERRLNEEHGGSRYQRFEILNFSVSGYRITQLADLASVKVSRFQPDAYFLALTDFVFRDWANHIWSLIDQGIDLKYEPLRDVVRRSGASREIGEAESRKRLQPYRLEVTRWVLQHIQKAAGPSVPVVIILTPTSDEQEVLERRFYSTKRLLQEFDFPVVDLLDTFDRVPDLVALRLAPMDHHFNAEGHRVLFEHLYRKLRENPEAWTSVVGSEFAE